jgi:hypothetical protein
MQKVAKTWFLVVSPEPFEALPFGFANRADGGRLLAGAEVAADPAAPNGESRLLAGPSWCAGGAVLGALTLGRATLRDGLNLSLAPQDLVRDIEGAVATPPVEQVGIAVVAGAGDVEIFPLVPRGQPTGTGPIAVPLLINEQPFHQLPGELPVGVKVVAGSLRLLVQPPVESVHLLGRNSDLLIHSPSASLISSGLYPTTHLELSTTKVGKDAPGFQRRTWAITPSRSWPESKST